jgi:parvulin-like peptidyl-prolyl isomerase
MELFRKLAAQHNEDAETKERQGDLRFFSKTPDAGETNPPQAVRDAAFTLEKTGQVFGEVVQSDDGFHVVKLTGQRPALNRSLDDARRLIQNRLWRTKREAAIEAFVAELRKKAEVKENLDMLAKVKIDLEAPAGKPGEPDDEREAAGDQDE